MRKEPRPGNDRLISGKLRSKSGRSGAESKTVSVDGHDYAWSVRHEWTVGGKGVKVVSVSVSRYPERTRELILDFSLRVSDKDATLSDTRLLQVLPSAMRSAQEAGWDPESRGRAFRHEVAETVPAASSNVDRTAATRMTLD